MNIIKFFIVISFFISFSSFSIASPLPFPIKIEKNKSSSSSRSQLSDFTHRINNKEIWDIISTRPASHVFAHTQVAKFIFDTQDNWTLYFTNTEKWKIHYDFVKAHIDKRYPHVLFNEQEYRTRKRRFIMGSLVYYADADKWVMEIVPGDTMSAGSIKKAHKLLTEATFFKSKIHFRPQSSIHDQRIIELNNSIPIWKMTDVQSSVKFQPVTLGITFGYVRLIEKGKSLDKITPHDILITEDVPDDLPICAGLITSKMQMPLAHISLLLENRQTPNMSIKDAIHLDKWKGLKNRLVRLDIQAQDYSVRVATSQEAFIFWKKQKDALKKTLLKPKIIKDDIGLPDVCDMRLKDIGAIGGKAAHLGAVCHIIPKIKTPNGFVVPSFYYITHLNKAKTYSLISSITAKRSTTELSSKTLDNDLNIVQNTIKDTYISPDLIKKIRQKINALDAKKFIFRSSTNVEDIQGFSGAGLYHSEVIKKTASDDEISTALKNVWASAWNIRAYKERSWYNISQKDVAMAILIQPFIEDLSANGVAITSNPFFKERPGFLINAQIMGGTITAGTGSEYPESFIIYTYTKDLEIHSLSKSTLNNGEPVLSQRTIKQLKYKLAQIHNHFISKSDAKKGRAMDVEFLVTKQGNIIIVQARPYQTHYRDRL